MKIIISKTHFRLLFRYKGHGKKVGILNFANGQTLRFFGIALHIWKPTEQHWRPFSTTS